MLDIPPFSLRVIDLKQYVYCPRILYYHTVLPAVRPVTYKMEAGIAAHGTAVAREKRRQLRTYGLEEGRRHFDAPLYSPQLNLSGELDLLIETEDELIPVDYKNSKRVGTHFRLQLMAYGRLLKDSLSTQDLRGATRKKVRRGFLYLLPARKAVAVSFTARLERQLESALAETRKIAEWQYMPPPTPHRRRCLDCEFRRFCNDIT